MRAYIPTLLLLASLVACASSESAGEMSAQESGAAALVEARRLVLEGDPRDAMIELDEALISVDDSLAFEVQFLRGECALRMGVEDGNAILFEDARNAFLRAADEGGIKEAWFGAARASWQLYAPGGETQPLEAALDYLRQGGRELGDSQPFVNYLGVPPERTAVEICFTAYMAAKQGALPEDRTAALFEETRAAIDAVVGTTPEDGWGWGQLANLLLWEERSDEARDVLRRGLQLAPEDSALHDSYAGLVHQGSGWEGVESSYAQFVANHEGLALGHWHLARARYELALARLFTDRSDESQAFAAVEAGFRRARELNESYTQACLGYEVICRDGIGWSTFYAGDLEGAAAAFRSMEELFPGGMQWKVQDKLFSGVESLAYLLGQHNQAWERVLDRESDASYSDCFPHLVTATALANELFAYDGEDPNFANNAGYFNRDVATNYEQQGLAALMADTPDEESAHKLFRQAVEHMEKSYAAYVVAADLAPEDARVINDTGLILAYYLQRELDTARYYFTNSIAVGVPQLEAGIEDEDARTMTREAVGDAHQNLGVIALTIEGDGAAARPHFEKSLKYERSPRVRVTGYYLPLCDLLESGELDRATVLAAHAWSGLELETVKQRMIAMNTLSEKLGAQ